MKRLLLGVLAAVALVAVVEPGKATTAGHLLKSGTPEASTDPDITGSINKPAAKGVGVVGTAKKRGAKDPGVTGSIKPKPDSSR